MFLLRVVIYFYTNNIHELKTFLHISSKVKNHSKEEQARELVGVLNDYKIEIDKLE